MLSFIEPLARQFRHTIPSHAAMKTIVALVDFSDAAFKALKQVHHLAKAFDSHVILLHVVPMEPVVVDLGLASPTVMREASADVVNEDHAKLQQMQESLAKFGVNATTRQLTEGTADAVMAEVQNLNADLVVMGTHKHGWLYNFFVGSVVNDVLKRMTCPVLLVPADEA